MCDLQIGTQPQAKGDQHQSRGHRIDAEYPGDADRARTREREHDERRKPATARRSRPAATPP